MTRCWQPQFVLTKQEQLFDECIDWSDINSIQTINYHEEQLGVLKKINEASTTLQLHPESLNSFQMLIAQKFQKVYQSDKSVTTKLLDQFGIGGAEKIAQILIDYAH